MSILPMRKCKKCNHVFAVVSISQIPSCPKCGSIKSKEASGLDMFGMNKLNE